MCICTQFVWKSQAKWYRVINIHSKNGTLSIALRSFSFFFFCYFPCRRCWFPCISWKWRVNFAADQRNSHFVTITWFRWVHYYYYWWNRLFGGNPCNKFSAAVAHTHTIHTVGLSQLTCIFTRCSLCAWADIEFNRLRLNKIQILNTESVIITRDQFSRSMLHGIRMRYWIPFEIYYPISRYTFE